MTPNDSTAPGLCAALRLAPEYRDYVWGGSRLRPEIVPTAEAWVIYEQDRIATGPLAGQTLAQVAGQYGEALLGRAAVARTGARFPLLIKLLDCAAWLSLQVHPNDEQAQRLEGPGHFGKTEAWYFIEAEPGAEILCGLQPGTSPETLAQAVRGGALLDHMRRLPVTAGDAVLILPGTIHALGPGLLVYEVQQTSDITYRVWDWNRPATEGRKLHIELSLAVSDPGVQADLVHAAAQPAGGRQELVTSPYFRLEVLAGDGQPVALDTRGESFHTLTVIAGQAQVDGPGWSERLARFESAVVPAACGAYTLTPLQGGRILKASADV